MRVKNVTLWVLGGILILAALVGVFLHYRNTATQPDATPSVSGSDNYTFNQDKRADAGAAPDLKREVQFGSFVTQSARVDLQEKIDAVRNRLTADANRADDWFTLAVLYHGSSDYDAAREVWEYLLKVVDAPKSAVLYDNLGKLYKFDLKDFPKAEMYFKESIDANPESMTPYTELFELYRYLYKKETSSAVNIITAAAKKFPNATDPYILLAEYYRDAKNYSGARDAYTKAIGIAQTAGNVDLVNAIRHDMESLPK